LDLKSAQLDASEFSRLATQYMEAKAAYEDSAAVETEAGNVFNLRSTQSKKARVEMLYSELLHLTDKIDKGRKFQYFTG